MATDAELLALARRMKEELWRQIAHGHVDIADIAPYLQEAAGPQRLRDAFAADARLKGDVGAHLWAALPPAEQYRLYELECRQRAQLEDELRKLRTDT